MRRWLIVAGDLVPTGGMDHANLRLALFLARRKDQVEVVTHRADPALASHPGVTVHAVPRPLRSYLLGSPLLDRRGQRAAKAIAARGGRVITNGGNCMFGDVSWIHYVHAAHAPRGRAGWLPRLHLAATRASALESERRALPGARLLIANSRRTARDLTAHLGLPEQRIRVVYCGVDPEQFRPPTEQQRAAVRGELGLADGEQAWLFVGAMGDRRKGFDTLFEAWRRTAARSGRRLLVVGSSAELAAWRERAEAAGLARHLTFLGFRADVPRLMAGMDALVAPSRYEPFGLGVLEALCVGLPAITSRAAGVAERYPPGLGPLLLDDPEDPLELAARIERVSSELGRWSAQARAASAELRRHGWDEMAAQIAAAVEGG